MHLRFGDDGLRRDDRLSVRPLLPARHATRSERVHEIRCRIADDAYRSSAVAEEIARRILSSREL
jgi:hypothetical protein